MKKKLKVMAENPVRSVILIDAAAYRAMAADEAREAEAHEWIEATVLEVSNDVR